MTQPSNQSGFSSLNTYFLSPEGVFACKSSQSSPSFFLELQVEREQINPFHGPLLNSRREAIFIYCFQVPKVIGLSLSIKCNSITNLHNCFLDEIKKY
jgi:hypothetical protein